MNNLLKIATGLSLLAVGRPVDKKEEESWASAQNKNYNIRLKPILVSQSCYGLKPVAIVNQYINENLNSF